MLPYIYIGLNVKYRLFLLDFNKWWIFSPYLGKLIKTKFVKTRPVAEEFFHADTQIDRRTDRYNEANCLF